jgi:hypothetical protein
MSGYQSPAAAFSNSIEESLLRRDAKRRQDMLDAHQIKMDEANLEFRREDLKARREDRHQAEVDRQAKIAQTAKDAEAAQYAKQVAGKKPGDVFTPDMAQRAITTGNADDFAPPEAQQFTDDAGQATTGTAPMEGVLQNEATPQERVMNLNKNAPIKFLGSPVQREQVATDKRRADFRATLTGPERKDADYQDIMGHPRPASESKTANNVKVTFFDKVSGKNVEKYVSQEVAAQMGQMESPHPPPHQPAQGPQPHLVQTSNGSYVWASPGKNAEEALGPDGEPIEAALTGTTKTMMEGAKMLQPHIARVDGLAKALNDRSLFGPVMSRMREAAAKVGTIDAGDFDKSNEKLQQFAAEFNRAVENDPQLSTDALVGQFSSELGLLASGAGRVHGGARGGGSITMIEYMKGLLSSGGTYQMFHGRMTGLDSYIGDYAKGPAKKKDGSAAGSGKKTRYNLAGEVIPND